MKKLIYLFILGIGFTSCSVESLDSTENLLTADVVTSTGAVTISPSAGVLCAGEVLWFSVDVNTTSNFQVQQLIKGIWTQVLLAQQGQSGSVPFEVVLAEGENFFRYTNQGTGSNWANYPTTFTGINCDTCENTLVADLVCGEVNTLTVTFAAEEAGPIVIQGGLTNGTTIISATSADLTRNIEHSSVLNSNANVTRWEGNVDGDCGEEVSVTITFSGGNGIGSWSAKRGEEVLGATEEQSCNE